MTQPIPYLMSQPLALTVQTPNSPVNSMLPVFYFAQFPNEHDWYRDSVLTIKKVGIFCNFSDGLVQKQNTSRVTMTVTIAIYDLVPVVAGLVDFTAGSNLISLDLPGLVLSAGDAIADTTSNQFCPYFIQSAPGPYPGSADAYITDYARATSLAIPVTQLVVSGSKKKDFVINNLAVLNTMQETEIFFPYAPGANQRLLISCQLGIDSDESSLDFYTDTVNPAFNGRAISFDSVLEAEITPDYLNQTKFPVGTGGQIVEDDSEIIEDQPEIVEDVVV